MQTTELTDNALTQLGVKFKYEHNNPGHGGKIIEEGPFSGLNLRPSIATRSGYWYADIPDGDDAEMIRRFGIHFYRRNDGYPIITALNI
jgi:hypothetical protein